MSVRRALATVLLPAVLFLVLSQALVHAQEPDASPLATDIPDSAATEVFVLGTPHLSEVADRFEPSMVAPLITALDDFSPDAIAVEKVSGRQAAAMERWNGRWGRVAQRFAGEFLSQGKRVQKNTGWSWSEANQRADSLLTVARSDADTLDSTARLALVQSLTAAYRLPSATLQWSYLSKPVRTTQTTLSDNVASALTDRLDAANEVYSIAMRLAHERGHQRLYPIDHQAEKDRAFTVYPRLMKAIGDSMSTLFDTHPVPRRSDSLMDTGLEHGSLLPLYRFDNSERRARADVDLQWRTMLDVDLPDKVGRQWLALWETRNLHMAGHIQRVVSQHSGGTVLVIVGGSHKPFFDAYLQQMMGVQVVDADDVLPAP